MERVFELVQIAYVVLEQILHRIFLIAVAAWPPQDSALPPSVNCCFPRRGYESPKRLSKLFG
jgi:hypothetical protein